MKTLLSFILLTLIAGNLFAQKLEFRDLPHDNPNERKVVIFKEINPPNKTWVKDRKIFTERRIRIWVDTILDTIITLKHVKDTWIEKAYLSPGKEITDDEKDRRERNYGFLYLKHRKTITTFWKSYLYSPGTKYIDYKEGHSTKLKYADRTDWGLIILYAIALLFLALNEFKFVHKLPKQTRGWLVAIFIIDVFALWLHHWLFFLFVVAYFMIRGGIYMLVQAQRKRKK